MKRKPSDEYSGINTYWSHVMGVWYTLSPDNVPKLVGGKSEHISLSELRARCKADGLRLAAHQTSKTRLRKLFFVRSHQEGKARPYYEDYFLGDIPDFEEKIKRVALKRVIKEMGYPLSTMSNVPREIKDQINLYRGGLLETLGMMAESMLEESKAWLYRASGRQSTRTENDQMVGNILLILDTVELDDLAKAIGRGRIFEEVHIFDEVYTIELPTKGKILDYKESLETRSRWHAPTWHAPI